LRDSESLFLAIRGLRYHVRRWPPPSGRSGAPRMFLLHGWMDVSASFQFVVDALGGDWEVYAPDWRGYGLTEWGRSDSYWFPDYIADLDCLLEEFESERPVNLVGHSLGGNVAALYAGIRPARVARLVNLRLAWPRPAEQAPKRWRWLNELHERPSLRPYKASTHWPSACGRQSQVDTGKANFLARHWAGSRARPSSCAAPGSQDREPASLRVEEVQACWRAVSAPVLWVDAAESDTLKRLGLTEAQHAERRSSFSNLAYKTVKDAGHMLHHDQPEEVARLIEAFLASG
jgi:pimeloyl-ACP methyl ester carboxylesterase